MSKPPTILERGYVGLGDKDLWLTWEAHLYGSELDDWRRVQGILERATPEFRAAAMNLLAGIELAQARVGYKQALAAEEVCRRDRIVGFSNEWKDRIKQYGEALGAHQLAEAACEAAVRKARETFLTLDTRYRVLQFMLPGFRRIYGPWDGWAWPGAAWGRGQSAYDTPDGVAQVKSEVAASHRRRHEGGTAAQRSLAPEPEGTRASPRRGDQAPGLFDPTKK